MASDPLREAIERALPCTCADQSQTCPRGFSADVHKAVAPLLAAERASKRAEANAILDANSMEECARLRAALAASDGEPDGPQETPTYNGPQEAAHRMDQARRLK